MVIVMRKFIEITSEVGSKMLIPVDEIHCVFKLINSETTEIYFGKDDEHVVSITPYYDIVNYLIQD